MIYLKLATTNKNIGGDTMLFKDVLNKRKMSGYQLSKRTGIPQSTIASWVNGDRNPLKMSFDNASKVSKTLNISMDVLFDILSS